MSQPTDPQAPMPADPMSAMDEDMLAYHVMYEGAIKAGFSDAQAMHIVTSTVIDDIRHKRAERGDR